MTVLMESTDSSPDLIDRPRQRGSDPSPETGSRETLQPGSRAARKPASPRALHLAAFS